jgi:hypothetical protein
LKRFVKSAVYASRDRKRPLRRGRIESNRGGKYASSLGKEADIGVPAVP